MMSNRKGLCSPAHTGGPAPGGSASLPAGTGEDWPLQLEIIGAELFQRYRKRLMMPGIALEIRGDYPGLSLADVLIRVHAGRRILQSRDDFDALEAIRDGRWQRYLAQRQRRVVTRPANGDRLSRWLVRIGGAVFVLFCLLSLLSALPPGTAGMPLLLGLTLAIGFVVWWGQSRRDAAAAPGMGAGSWDQSARAGWVKSMLLSGRLPPGGA